jgi:6-phosphogluconolactonase (cycloisomerase 2 family)
VTDIKNGVVLGYSIASNGVLTPLTSGTGGTNKFPAGNSPSAIVIDQSFPFAYVANSVDSTVNAYTMSNGALTRVATYSTGSQPIAMGIDPSTAHFLYTVNFLGSSMNGWQLSETAGTLLISQNSPYATDANPTAVAAIPHNGTGGGIH